MIEYRGYTGVFEFDPELELFTGHVIDLRDEVYFEGDSVAALRASLKRAVDHYLKVCEARREEPERPFSGKLNVRLGSELHRAVAVAAASAGESINAWIARVVEAATRETTSTSTPARSASPESSRKSRARAKGKRQPV